MEGFGCAGCEDQSDCGKLEDFPLSHLDMIVVSEGDEIELTCCWCRLRILIGFCIRNLGRALRMRLILDLMWRSGKK